MSGDFTKYARGFLTTLQSENCTLNPGISLCSGDKDWAAGPEISTKPVAIIDNLAGKLIFIDPGAILYFRSFILNILNILKIQYEDFRAGFNVPGV